MPDLNTAYVNLSSENHSLLQSIGERAFFSGKRDSDFQELADFTGAMVMICSPRGKKQLAFYLPSWACR